MSSKRRKVDLLSLTSEEEHDVGPYSAKVRHKARGHRNNPVLETGQMLQHIPEPYKSWPCLTRSKSTTQAVPTGARFHPYFCKGHTNMEGGMLVNLGRDSGRVSASMLWAGRSCLSAGAEKIKPLPAKPWLGPFCYACLGLLESWGSPGFPEPFLTILNHECFCLFGNKD